MKESLYCVKGTDIKAHCCGPEDSPVTVFWGHGWGQSKTAFTALAEPFKNRYRHVFMDLPGFGDSAAPGEVWGTVEFADVCAAIISDFPGKKIWAGHSFGCRVGIQIAARHPDLVDGLFLISAAGLKRKRSVFSRLYLRGRVALFKALKMLVPEKHREKLYRVFGSADYRNAGVMRNIFVKVVNEDLSEAAKILRCPVQLVYGDNDDETPPEMGRRFADLIPGAGLAVLAGQDHYSVLGDGRHPVAGLLQRFIKNVEDSP